VEHVIRGLKMGTMTVDELVHLAEQLTPSDRVTLIERLKAITPGSDVVTRETILAEHARRIASGAFQNAESLLGRYGRPGFDLSFEDIEAAIHEHSWEDDFDQLFDAD
jgi:hypothetical protein